MDTHALVTDSLIEFCRRYHIRKMALFGSALRGELKPESDLDILVEFDPAYIPGLHFMTMQEELSALLGRRVDLNTPNFLSHHFRDEVLATAELLYERTG